MQKLKTSLERLRTLRVPHTVHTLLVPHYAYNNIMVLGFKSYNNNNNNIIIYRRANTKITRAPSSPHASPRRYDLNKSC